MGLPLTPTLIGANLRSSLPGLTRQSIDLRKNFLAKKMDARVKPAHDELAKQLKLAPMTPSLSPRQKRGGEGASEPAAPLCICFIETCFSLAAACR
jgi:hypothetical protein